jgi:hypothetical protein
VRPILALVVFAGCVGDIAAPGAVSGEPPATPPVAQLTDGYPVFQPTVAYQLRRLTTAQYLASAQTLLNVSATAMVEAVPPVAGFEAIGASSVVVSSGGVAEFEDAARSLAHTAFTSGAPPTPCTPSSTTDTTCFTAFVTQFGQRAFRRPLDSDEIASYTMLAANVATLTNDPMAALEATTTAFLQSPDFLYLVEIGESDGAGRLRFTDYEMASRLSYFLTENTPDDQLLAAAAAGMLTTPEGVQAQAERLLAMPQARTAVRHFFTAMFALDGLDTLNRDVAQFPSFTPTLAAALKEQTLRTFEDLVFDSDGDYRALFDSAPTFVNDELATFYGVTPPGNGTAFSKVTVDGKRLGLLGQAGVLSVHDHAYGTSPTKRGLFVLTRLLCQPLALSPPANLTIPPPPSGMLTARQRFEQHRQNAVCASCHLPMDSLGLSLEKFDALGEYRDTEYGMTIDDTGVLGPTTFKGEPALGTLLQQTPALEPCLAQAVFQSGVGRVAQQFDQASFQGFASNGGHVRALLSKIAVSDAFRYVPEGL